MKRNEKLDFLKAIALLFIMLAHTHNLPILISQIRSFDVVLLVMISAVLSSNKQVHFKNYTRYIGKRVLRIILPTWAFLSIFFSGIYLYTTLFNKVFPFSSEIIFESYMFLQGIGYLWIMWVYIFIAITGPLIFYIQSKIKFNYSIIMIFIAYVIYEFAVHYFTFENSIFSYLLNQIIYCGIGYSFVYYLTLIFFNANRINKVKISGINFLIYVIIAIIYIINNDVYIHTNIAKYPPTLYYLSYSLAASTFLMLIIEKVKIHNIINKVSRFISRNSMWIYLWHILGVYLWNEIIGLDNWILMWLFLILISLTITGIQINIIKKIKFNNKKLQKVINMWLT